MSVQGEAERASSRRQIWVLVVLFFAPLALAFFLYYGLDGWRPPGSTNYGTLIHPARPLPEVTLPMAKGGTFERKDWEGKWTIVYIGDGACDARCREALTLMRQTRLALGDDMPRVQRAFLVTGNCCDHAYLEREHAGLITLSVEGRSGEELLSAFPQDAPVREAGRIYIVDPLGNLMMSYDPGVPDKGLLKDLERLLKLSHIG
ncbi:MAG TPA: hypothetical protein VF193_03000 [Steroidobacter sp.]